MVAAGSGYAAVVAGDCCTVVAAGGSSSLVLLEVYVLTVLLDILVARPGAMGRGWTVLWHVGERQSVRHKAWHVKQRADSPVLTKGDSPAFFPRL